VPPRAPYRTTYDYKLQPAICSVSWIYLFLQTLYRFQAVSPPIIS